MSEEKRPMYVILLLLSAAISVLGLVYMLDSSAFSYISYYVFERKLEDLPRFAHNPTARISTVLFLIGLVGILTCIFILYKEDEEFVEAYLELPVPEPVVEIIKEVAPLLVIKVPSHTNLMSTYCFSCGSSLMMEDSQLYICSSCGIEHSISIT